MIWVRRSLNPLFIRAYQYSIANWKDYLRQASSRRLLDYADEVITGLGHRPTMRIHVISFVRLIEPYDALRYFKNNCSIIVWMLIKWQSTIIVATFYPYMTTTSDIKLLKLLKEIIVFVTHWLTRSNILSGHNLDSRHGFRNTDLQCHKRKFSLALPVPSDALCRLQQQATHWPLIRTIKMYHRREPNLRFILAVPEPSEPSVSLNLNNKKLLAHSSEFKPSIYTFVANLSSFFWLFQPYHWYWIRFVFRSKRLTYSGCSWQISICIIPMEDHLRHANSSRFLESPRTTTCICLSEFVSVPAGRPSSKLTPDGALASSFVLLNALPHIFSSTRMPMNLWESRRWILTQQGKLRQFDVFFSETCEPVAHHPFISKYRDALFQCTDHFRSANPRRLLNYAYLAAYVINVRSGQQSCVKHCQ